MKLLENYTNLNMNTTLFPTFDPISKSFRYYKARHLVHTDGDWHIGIQANIIKKNNHGSFDILLQQRSSIVDIAKYKYDQSLATQMIKDDNLSITSALKRGLSEELGIERYRCMKLDTNIYIIKTYDEDRDILNREIIHLFIVTVDPDEDIKTTNPKVLKLGWMSWDIFKDFYNYQKEIFTKTAQFYFSTSEILSTIEKISYTIINSVDDIDRNRTLMDRTFFHINTNMGIKKTHILENMKIKNISYLYKNETL